MLPTFIFFVPLVSSRHLPEIPFKVVAEVLATVLAAVLAFQARMIFKPFVYEHVPL